MTLELPTPEPTQPAPPPVAPIGFLPLRELAGSIVEVTRIEVLDGLPIVYVAHEDGTDRGYLATGEWAASCATAIEAYLKTRGGDEPVQVRVIEHDRSGIGFQTLAQ
jgi:hypothetical protein